MSSDVKARSSTAPVQEFTDQAITDPGELAALSRQLKRPARLARALWLAAVAAALVAGLLLGRFVLP